MDTSLDHFDDEDLALIASLQEEDGQDAGTQDDQQLSQQADTDTGVTSEQGTEGSQEAAPKVNDETPPAAQQEAQPADQGHGDVKAALRASRRAERKARDELAKANRELEELRSKVGTAPAADDLDDQLAADYPQIANALKKRDEQIAELKKAQGAVVQTEQASQQQEFNPPELPLEVQDIVDEIPDLLAMQHNPDQTGWQLAVGFDAALRAHPAWAQKTPQERFAEAARRAKAELGTPPRATASPAPDARAKAAQAVAAAGRRQPETLSDFGGQGNEPEGNNLTRFQRMSDDDIVADLLRGG